MRKIMCLFLLVCFIGLFSSIASSEEVNQNVFVNIETPFYSIENINSEIKFTVLNNGNDTFTGNLAYGIRGENIHWDEVETDLIIPAHDSTIVTRTIKPAYVGELGIYVTLQDVNGREVTSMSYPMSVHSLVDAAVIGSVLIGLLAFIHSLNKKK